MLALVDACGGTSDATDDSTPVVETIAEQKGDQLMVGIPGWILGRRVPFMKFGFCHRLGREAVELNNFDADKFVNITNCRLKCNMI